jgi:hypothetical protein
VLTKGVGAVVKFRRFYSLAVDILIEWQEHAVSAREALRMLAVNVRVLLTKGGDVHVSPSLHA